MKVWIKLIWPFGELLAKPGFRKGGAAPAAVC